MAEISLEFEHRDLHWGNILLSRTKEKTTKYRIHGTEIPIDTNGVRAVIIDFTLSRILVDNHCHHNDLSQDEELFSASGDYQFDIYRLMRTRLMNNWQKHEPYTNILWLHYVLDKMINGVNYKNTKAKKHRENLDRLKDLRNNILDFASAADFVDTVKKT